jgi:hypothetical protein
MDQPTHRFGNPDEPPSDHPTRRLDPLAADPTARPCLRCGTPLVEAWVSTDAQVISRRLFLHPILPPFTRPTPLPASTPCTAWACPACGYTELVAANPFALLPDPPP